MIHHHRVCLAPMLKITDRHFRYLMRLLSRHMFLYTEMIATNAILHGDQQRFLEFHDKEHPVGIQLGGGDSRDLAACAKIAEEAGYDEINLNVGCPSPRVHAGNFGAILMKEPNLVAECVAAMKEAVNIPVTVKTRTGIGREADRDYFHSFIEKVSQAGCKLFIIHARNIWFDVKRPKENRYKPVIRYEMVQELKKIFPHLEIIINGDINSLEEGLKHCEHVDGIMIGRLPFSDPYSLRFIDQLFYQDDHTILSREEIVETYLRYIEEEKIKPRLQHRPMRHLLNLFKGERNSTQWRRLLSENAMRKGGVSGVREILKNL